MEMWIEDLDASNMALDVWNSVSNNASYSKSRRMYLKQQREGMALRECGIGKKAAKEGGAACRKVVR
jgi:hypothetical protein